MVNKVLCVKDW